MDPATGGVSANDLDTALWRDRDGLAGVSRIATVPFDHTRRATSALVDTGEGRVVVVKGAPEQVIARCDEVPDTAQRTLSALFADGRRVVAVASRPADGLNRLTVADESGLALAGFLVFADTPKAAARDSLAQLAMLGIEVKIATGDNPAVAEKVCTELGLASKGTVTGAQLDEVDGNDFDAVARDHTIFARISPEQKARLISSLRRTGRSVGFLGDGVNDALALHPQTSAYPSTPPPTLPRTPRTSYCWTRISGCWQQASPKAGASSPTPSSTS